MNTKTEDFENTAIKSMRDLSLKTLCESIELTNKVEECEDFNNVAIVRGWLINELERRDPDKFVTWLLTEDITLMDYPTKFYL